MKKINGILLSKNTLLILYKLLYDALLLALVTFGAAIILEGMLPGFVSSHISLARIAITIFFILGGIVWIGGQFDITYDTPRLKRNALLPFLIIISFLLIGNSMLHFALWENIVITLTTLLIFFLFYNMLFSEK